MNAFSHTSVLSFRILVGVALLALAGAASAGTITYQVDRTIGAGTILGSITTDGDIGVLAQSDIVSWALTLTDPNLVGGSPDTISSAAAVQTTVLGADLLASATQITFNFDSTHPGGVALQGAGGNGWCFTDLSARCSGQRVQTESLFFTTTGSRSESVTQTGTQVMATVPEPGTLALFGLGLVGVGMSRRRLAR